VRKVENKELYNQINQNLGEFTILFIIKSLYWRKRKK